MQHLSGINMQSSGPNVRVLKPSLQRQEISWISLPRCGNRRTVAAAHELRVGVSVCTEHPAGPARGRRRLLQEWAVGGAAQKQI